MHAKKERKFATNATDAADAAGTRGDTLYGMSIPPHALHWMETGLYVGL